MDLTAVGAHPDDFDQVNKATPFCDRHRAFRILAGKDVEEMSALLLFLIRRILQLFDDARDVCDGLFRRQLLDSAFADPHDTAGLLEGGGQKIALFPKAREGVPKLMSRRFRMSFEFLNSRRGRTVTLYVTRLCSSACERAPSFLRRRNIA